MIFRFTIFEGRNFRENGQKSRKSGKFLPAKVSASKVERHHWCRPGVFIVNFEHISHLFLVFFIVNFERVIAG